MVWELRLVKMGIIRDYCQLYHGVTLGGTGKQHVKRHPTLEDGVYIGCGGKKFRKYHFKKGCRVGANAVVLKDVPEGDGRSRY